MHGGAWELARRIRAESIPRPGVLFVSDYVDVPQLLGWLPPHWADLPVVLYFHENQLTYPRGPESKAAEQDLGPAFTNIASMCRADRAVFNSEYHRADFRTAAFGFLDRLPRPVPRAELEAAFARSHVVAPGVDLDRVPLGLGPGPTDPLRVLFAHRWEHDKDPLTFLRTVRAVVEDASDPRALELVLLGERGTLSADLQQALEDVSPQVLHDGFVESAEAHAGWLGRCDLAVSTARHEFFGIGTVEALAAGCGAWLPDRLSYPELLGGGPPDTGLYRGVDELHRGLLAAIEKRADFRDPERRRARRSAIETFDVTHTTRALDRILGSACSSA